MADPWTGFNLTPGPPPPAQANGSSILPQTRSVPAPSDTVLPDVHDWSGFNLSPGQSTSLGNTWSDWGNAALKSVQVGGALTNAADIGTRTGIRVLSALPDLAATAGNFGGYEIGKFTGLPYTPQPLPSQTVINALDIAAPKDQSSTAQTAENYLPLFTPSGWERIAESPTFWSKVGTYGRQAAATNVDAYLGQKASDFVKTQGGDEVAQFLAQIAAGGTRTAATRGAGNVMQSAYGGENAPNVFDASKRLGFLPTFGMVASDEGKSAEKNIMATPIAGRGIENARTRNRQAIERGLDEATGEVAGGPGAGPIGGTSNPDEIGQPVITAAQDTQNQLIAANKARENALERNIGTRTSTEVSPVVAEMNRIMTSDEIGPNIGRTIAPRAADVNESIARFNPNDPNATTMTYGAAKDIRGDLGKTTQTMDEVPGAHQDVLYGKFTSGMQDAAASKGQAQEFTDANEAYRQMKQEQIPFLQQFSGKRNETDRGGVTFDATPQAGVVAKRVQTASTVDPATLTGMRANLGDDVTGSAVANIIRNYGAGKGGFKPEEFSDAYNKLNQPTQQLVQDRSPAAAQKLADVNTTGGQFELRPERPGLTKSIASQLFMDRLVRAGGATRLSGIAALAGGMESPDAVRALAGRADIPAILSQYALRQALINQQRQRDAAAGR